MTERCDIRFITVDSCRYDSAKVAQTPNLDKIGSLRKGETSGSYTYPAHQAFFIGDIPRIVEGQMQYIDGFDQVWRSASARQTNKPVFCLFDAPDIITHYQRVGYNVQGYGGVGFFNKNDRNNSLPKLFLNFHYFDASINSHPYEKIPRTERTLPLGNIDLISASLDKDVPYFLFVNSPATHIPYDTPGTNPDNDYLDLIKRVYVEQNLKRKHNKGELPFTPDEIAFLKHTQVNALEWVDHQVGELLSRLPLRRPTLTIVCADHGEEFGDNGRFGHAHVDKSVLEVPIWASYSE
jgi:hypothetical protein